MDLVELTAMRFVLSPKHLLTAIVSATSPKGVEVVVPVQEDEERPLLFLGGGAGGFVRRCRHRDQRKNKKQQGSGDFAHFSPP